MNHFSKLCIALLLSVFAFSAHASNKESSDCQNHEKAKIEVSVNDIGKSIVNRPNR